MEKWERRDAKRTRRMPVHGFSVRAIQQAILKRAK